MGKDTQCKRKQKESEGLKKKKVQIAILILDNRLQDEDYKKRKSNA